MKKMTMICMAALLMLAASCKKDKKDEIENAGSGFRATVEQQNGDSKTHLDGLAVNWDSGDAILVKSSTCPEPRGFTTTGSGATVNFDADETLPADFYAPNYTGYYPADKFEGDQLTLPATQAYVENTFANGVNPMAATSSETLLPFKNICGVLKLQLYSASACQVRRITITSNNNENLYGTGTVTLTDGIPTLGTLSNGGTTLTLDCGESGIALSADASQLTDFYFVVPSGTLGTSFTVKVTETDGKIWSKTANAPQNLIARSQITVLPKQAVDTKVVPSNVTLTAGCSSEDIYNLGGSVTVPSGSHTCEYGLVYSETDATPTIEEGASKLVVNTETFSGTRSFSADLTGLAAGTTYHVCAYALIEGPAYSTAKEIVGGNEPLPLPSNWTGGKNPHPFTVASGKVVHFSQGNLQYKATGSSATAASGANVGGTWRFAEHQFDFVGNATLGNVYEGGVKCDNTKVAQTYDGWIDLFGFGTSGYNHGGTCYQPWSTSKTPKQYYAYSTSSYTYSLEDGPSPHTGKADWGKANAISNGSGSSWRTLTGGDSGEWYYLIKSRPNAAKLYGEGKVGNCIPGLIILPDDWVLPDGLSFTPFTPSNPPQSSWSDNVYSYFEWSKMEAAGAVFLPVTGSRLENSVFFLDDQQGYYWSSSYYDSENACNLYFSNGWVLPYKDYRYYGFSVRLVSDN